MSTPDYLRVAESIIAQVDSGELKPGDRLPSAVALAARYGVSSGTVDRAMVHLRALKIIRGHQGKGVYIAEPEGR